MIHLNHSTGGSEPSLGGHPPEVGPDREAHQPQGELVLRQGEQVPGGGGSSDWGAWRVYNSGAEQSLDQNNAQGGC